MTTRSTEGPHNNKTEECAKSAEDSQYPEDSADKFIRELGKWIQPKIREAKVSEWILAFTSIALWVVGCGQYQLTKQNNTATSPLVQYAKDSTAAAQDNANASQQFADSTDDINSGISDAVDKLNVQANNSSRLAKATEESNATAIENDRPWMGGTINVIDFRTGGKPQAICTFTNVGRRPARIETMHCRTEVPENFWADAIDPRPVRQGKAIAVPGQPTSVTYFFFQSGSENLIKNGQMTEELFKLFDQEKWHIQVFGTITYRDARTTQLHHSSICVEYHPVAFSVPAGFSSCPNGNEAD